jgi:hypothetical protein
VIPAAIESEWGFSLSEGEIIASASVDVSKLPKRISEPVQKADLAGEAERELALAAANSIEIGAITVIQSVSGNSYVGI